MITPAITVLGAVEGLKVATSAFDDFVVPISIVILISVFAIQRYGTDRVGGLFLQALDVDEVLAHLLVAEGFTKIEELAETPIDELNRIEGFETELSTELQNRAIAWLDPAFGLGAFPGATACVSAGRWNRLCPAAPPVSASARPAARTVCSIPATRPSHSLS